MSETCPICGHPITQDGVCIAIDDGLKHHVTALYDNRPQANLTIDPESYKRLPGLLAKQDFIWRIRMADVEIVLNRLGAHPQTILEIGSWNGWLSHHIAQKGHTLTALGYSAHPINGLGAKRHYNTDWHAIQTNLSELNILQGIQFDTVIINHGLHYFSDPTAYVQKVRQFIKPDGQLILLNVIIYRDPSLRIAQIHAQRSDFEHKYKVPYFLQPTRGYLDLSDKNALLASGVQLFPYSHLWRSNLKSRLKATAPAYYYSAG